VRKIPITQLFGFYFLIFGPVMASNGDMTDPSVMVLEPQHFQMSFRVTMKSGEIKEQKCEEPLPTTDEIEQFLKGNPQVTSAEVVHSMKPSREVRALVFGRGFYRRQVKDQEIQTAVQNFPNVTCVDISYHDVENIGHLSGLKQLEKLIMGGAIHDRLGMLTTIGSLRDLELTDMDLKRLPPCLKGLPLKRLVLSKNRKLNFAGVPQLTTLEELDISHINVEDYKFLASFAPNLKVINISGNRSVAQLKSKWFSELTSLVSLKASDARLSTTQALKELVKGAPSLTFLNVSCNSRDEVVDFSVVSELDELVELDLSFNNLTGVELGFLEDLVDLRKLDISSNERNGEPPMLSRLPRDCSKITHLRVGRMGLKSFYDIPLNRFEALQHLDVSSNKNFFIDLHSAKLLADSLTSLVMRNLTMTAEGFTHISMLTRLEELDMDETKVGKDNSWIKALVSLPLKKLIIHKQDGRVYTGTALDQYLGK
jgi:Leucine-rich repeat (LRR) protein